MDWVQTGSPIDDVHFLPSFHASCVPFFSILCLLWYIGLDGKDQQMWQRLLYQKLLQQGSSTQRRDLINVNSSTISIWVFQYSCQFVLTSAVACTVTLTSFIIVIGSDGQSDRSHWGEAELCVFDFEITRSQFQRFSQTTAKEKKLKPHFIVLSLSKLKRS